MNEISSFVRVVFDPVNVGVGIVVVALTLTILRRVYKEEPAPSRTSFLARFVTAYENCEFQATAAGRLTNYFDADRLLMASPDLLQELSLWFVDKLQRYPSAKVCFIEKDSGPVGALLMASLLASQLGRPVSTVRPRREVWKMAIEGEPINQGDEVILIQDVVTSGFQIVQGMRPLEKRGARVVAVMALVDREEQRMDEDFVAKNIDLITVRKLSEIQKDKKEPTEH